MTYQVRLSKIIRRSLNDLPGNVRNIVRERIISLAEQSRPQDAKELEGHPNFGSIP
jgi:mRNA-degrading endonuclease RelE of RelBE toxin-antitoxin system